MGTFSSTVLGCLLGELSVSCWGERCGAEVGSGAIDSGGAGLLRSCFVGGVRAKTASHVERERVRWG